MEPGTTIGSGSVGPSRRHAQFAPGEMTSKMTEIQDTAIDQTGSLVDKFSELDIPQRELRDTFGDITSASDMPGGSVYEMDMSKYLSQKADVPFTGSQVSASQAQESAILKNELKDFQFSDFAEGMRSDPGSKSIPFSGSGGTDFTQTPAWEGVGEGFPVTSPDFIGSDASRALGASQYSAGRRDIFDTERHKKMQQSLGWHKRLFPDQ
jgi:hypothetical protein